MLEFIMLTIGVTLGTLLSGVIACMIMLNPKVIKWYTQRYLKTVEQAFESLESDEKDED